MKTVVAYLAGVPSAHKSPHKIEVLTKFVTGVNQVGDRGIAHQGSNLLPADVAIIQGWVHEGSSNSPHLLLRKNVYETQKKNNKHTIIVDSNLFNYKTKNHPIHYSRYSMDGVFPTTGNYFWDNPDPARWQQISRDLGITLKDWQTNGNHILICAQRNGGWSMNGLDVMTWVEQTVRTLRKYTDRPIIVRGHPGDKNIRTYLKPSRNSSWTVSRNEKIVDDFRNAWAVVTYNSSPGVAAAIEGVPVFVTDPTPQISQAYEVANTDLKDIKNPITPERLTWVEKLSMCHWKFEELSSGVAWAHMRKYI